MRIIGISGRRQAGKDTLAGKLLKFAPVLWPGQLVKVGSISDRPKRILNLLCGVPREHLWGTNEQKGSLCPSGKMDCREAPRRLIRLLMDVDEGCLIRDLISEQYMMGADMLLVPGVRNLVDCEVIRAEAGRLVRLARVLHPEDDFPEELELDTYRDFDCIIDNAGRDEEWTFGQCLRYLKGEGWIDA